ncbi:MAG: tetratricopeptide repeat protein [Candidatus Obscuribacter sp.]|nr:tetratricopeptide repeat protein [Candidatus Obscuribacter sp.]
MQGDKSPKRELKVKLGRETYLNAYMMLLIMLILLFLTGWALFHYQMPGWVIGLTESLLVIFLFLLLLFGGFVASLIAAARRLNVAALVAQMDLVLGRPMRKLIIFDFGMTRLSLLILANKAIFDGQLLDAEALLKPLFDVPEEDPVASNFAFDCLEKGLMAHVFAWTGRKKEAERMLEATISAAEDAYGRDQGKDQSIMLAEVYCNTGCMLGLLEDKERALGVLSRGLSMREQIYGAETEEAAKALNNLGQVQLEAGDLTGAEVSLRRARKILETDRKDTSGGAVLGYVLDTLATVLLELGQSEEAYELSARALKLGQLDVHERAARLFTMGRCLEKRGDLRRALDYHDRALAGWSKMQGFEHPLVERCKKSRESLASRRN